MDSARTHLNGSQVRPFATRHRGLVLASTVVAGVALGIRYKAEQIRKNEIAQKNSDIPNFYVSVDRSGGGI